MPVERSRGGRGVRGTCFGSLSSATPRRRTASSRSTSPRPSRPAHATQTILEVARENGINIPTLCNLPGLTPIGACRLCLVEVQGVPKLLTACVTRVTEGMVVKTDSERLRRFRRTTLELLFAEKACEMGIKVIGWTGNRESPFPALCDLCIQVPSPVTPRVQEMHILIGHIICELSEKALCG